MRGVPALLPLLLAACGSMAGNAALNTGLGAGAAAYQRSHGECYAVCQKGTACDHASGECKPIPCGGECRVGEVCRNTPFGERCVSQQEFEVRPSPEGEGRWIEGGPATRGAQPQP